MNFILTEQNAHLQTGVAAMLNKTMIMLTAAVVLSSASAAFAYEDPENRLGDRYPFLEQAYQPSQANKYAGRYVTPRQVVTLNQYSNEAVENKIGDRYPSLEQAYQPAATSRYVAARQVASSVKYANESPENKIGDRYPFLEAQYVSQRAPARTTAARRELTTRTVR
jgi:hypothetical protein